MSNKLKSFLSKYKKAYFVGIKGVGMTSLAIILKEAGIDVSGSDTDEVFHTDEILSSFKIPVKKGFYKSNIDGDTDLIIVTGAHGGMTNIEAQEGLKRNIPTFMHGKFLGLVMENSTGISIAGCHGKTTTSAMLANILRGADIDASYCIGCAGINPRVPPGHLGSADIFVAEADEYATCPITDKTPRFHWQNPKVAIINNIEFDHPDVYKDIKEVRNAFLKFSQKVPKDGLLIAGIDSREVDYLVKDLDRKIPYLTFGTAPEADYQIKSFKQSENYSSFDLFHKGNFLTNITLQVPGLHNARNAAASFIAADFLGIDKEKIKSGLKLFTGTKRRFEKITSVKSISLYDDYAHHPTEIQATLLSARNFFPNKRLIIIFQPHTYSRTKSLLKELSVSFNTSNTVALITDIFASKREIEDHSINSEILTNNIRKFNPDAHYLPSKDNIMEFLQKNIKPNDIIFTLGAGDIYKIHPGIIALLKERYV